jgi:adsorption protein B
VLHVGYDAHQRPVLAVAGPLTDADLADVTAAFSASPVLRVARESEVHAGLRHWREGMRQLAGEDGAQNWDAQLSGSPASAMPLLGDLLIRSGLIDRARFEAALSTYSPSTHGRIGAYLVEKGVVTRDQVDAVLRQQRESHDTIEQLKPVANPAGIDET